MGNKRFNEALGSYLDKKRKRSNTKTPMGKKVSVFFKQTYQNISISEQYPELDEGRVHVIKEEKPFLKRVFGKNTKEKPVIREELTEAEMIKLNNTMSNKNSPETEFESEEEEMEQEIEDSPSVSDRIKGFFRSLFGSSKTASPEYSDSYEVDEMSREEIIEEIEEIDAKEEALIQKENELKEERQGLLSRLFSRFSSNNTEEEVEEGEEEVYTKEEYEALVADLKKISKFSLFVIQLLPKRKVEDLKDSKQFERFKSILKKRGLIKE